MDHEIWWQVKSSNSSFWFDNWTRLGALYFIVDSPVSNEASEVRDLISNGHWDTLKLKEALTDDELVEYIADNIPIPK